MTMRNITSLFLLFLCLIYLLGREQHGDMPVYLDKDTICLTTTGPAWNFDRTFVSKESMHPVIYKGNILCIPHVKSFSIEQNDDIGKGV